MLTSPQTVQCFTGLPVMLLPSEAAAIQAGAEQILRMHHGLESDRDVFKTAASSELTRTLWFPEGFDACSLNQGIFHLKRFAPIDAQGSVFEPAFSAMDRVHAKEDRVFSRGGPAALIGAGAAIMAGAVEMPPHAITAGVEFEKVGARALKVPAELWRRVNELYRPDFPHDIEDNLVGWCFGSPYAPPSLFPDAGGVVLARGVGDPYFALIVHRNETFGNITVMTEPSQGASGDGLMARIADERCQAALLGIQYMLGHLDFANPDTEIGSAFRNVELPKGVATVYDRLHVARNGVTVVFDGDPHDFFDDSPLIVNEEADEKAATEGTAGQDWGWRFNPEFAGDLVSDLPPIPEGELPALPPQEAGVARASSIGTIIRDGGIRYIEDESKVDAAWDGMKAKVRDAFAGGIHLDHALIDVAEKLARAFSPDGRVTVRSQKHFNMTDDDRFYVITTDEGRFELSLTGGKAPFAVLTSDDNDGGRRRAPGVKLVFNDKGRLVYRMASADPTPNTPDLISSEVWIQDLARLPIYAMLRETRRARSQPFHVTPAVGIVRDFTNPRLPLNGLFSALWARMWGRV